MTELNAFDAAEFARRIGMSEDWVRRNAKSLPHRKYGRRLRFTDEDVRIFFARTAFDPERVTRTLLARKQTR